MTDDPIKCMSAQRFLKSLKPSTVGAIILDPPSALGVGESEDETPMDEMLGILTPMAETVERMLLPGGASIFIGDPVPVSAWEMATSWAGMRLSAEMIVLWDTGISRSQANSLSTTIRWHTKAGLRTLRRPRPVVISSNIILAKRPEFRSPRQRPVELFNFLISLLTEPNDLVADLFCGNGSSMVSAKMCGRRFTGCDLDPRKILEANRRLRQIELEESDLKPLYLWSHNKLELIGS